MKKALLVYSGGLDSTVLLYKLKSEGILGGAISVDYSQKHSKELFFARKNCEKLGVDFLEVDLRCLRDIFGNSSLVDNKTNVPAAMYEETVMHSTVVPNRNMILLSIAAARAISAKCNCIAYAAHSGDHAIYPDCRPEFVNAMAGALKICDYTPIELYAPFVNLSKAQIIAEGAKLGVDFSMTWSCYRGGESHCGVCPTCVERKESFKIAGVPDPTVYANS